MSDAAQDFTPVTERKSEKINFGHYLWKFAQFFLVTKLAALAGAVVGNKVGGKHGGAGALIGSSIAGTAAAFHEGYRHWIPVKATQERVAALLPEVKRELDPAHLREEAALQQHIHDGLAERKKLFIEIARRNEPVQPRGNAVDALAKESETIYPTRA